MADPQQVLEEYEHALDIMYRLNLVNILFNKMFRTLDIRIINDLRLEWPNPVPESYMASRRKSLGRDDEVEHDC